MVSSALVSQDGGEGKRSIALEEVARAVLELATQPDLNALVARFLELVRAWATPSAVLAAVEDTGTEAGWRLLPALCVGTGPLGTERIIARLIEETPEGRKRPLVVQPLEETPGVRVRDNWIVPWWHEGESGVLVLRGVPRDCPANLGDALLAASTPVWPRLLGSPAARVEALVKGIHGAADRLQAEAARHLERIEQARKAPVEAAEAAAEREAQLEAARKQAQSAAQLHEEAKARVAALEDSLRKAEEQRDQARTDLERAAESARAKQQQAEQQRDQARTEVERMSARVAEVLRDSAGAAEQLEQARSAAGAAQHALSAAQQELTAKSAALTECGAALEKAKAALGQAQARAEQPEASAQQGEQTEAVRGIFDALRRAAFVPARLRTSLEKATALAGHVAAPQAAWLSVVLLDRDSPPPIALASELEAAGIRVRLASEPEELALLVRDPAAADVGVAICDITTFRPDQNVAGLLRSWEKDKRGLEFYISFTQDPSEIERARRVPLSLVAGHVQRPIRSAALLESLEILARKLGKLK